MKTMCARPTPILSAFLTVLFCTLSLASASAAPVIQSAAFAGKQLTIKGSGLSGTTVTVSFNGQSLPIVSDTSTKIIATLTTAPAPGTYRTVVKVDTTSTAAYVSISPAVLSGAVNSDGTTFLGHGFTSSKTGTGTYELKFPAGTFNGVTFPVPVFMPEGGVTVTGLSAISFSGDGSATLDVLFSGDTFFSFNVAQSR